MRVTFSLRFLMLTFTAVACGIAAYFNTRGLHETHHDFDLAIVGNGYFQVIDAGENTDAMIHYTRSGKLRIDSGGRLSLRDQDRDWIIEPSICVPDDWTEFVVRKNGEVSAFVKGKRYSESIGCLQIAKFDNENALTVEAKGVYLSNDSSGQATSFEAGENTCAIIRKGWLDESNRAGNPLAGTTVFCFGMAITIGIEKISDRRVKKTRI